MKYLCSLIFLIAIISSANSQNDSLEIVKQDVLDLTTIEHKSENNTKVLQGYVSLNGLKAMEMQIVNYILNSYWDRNSAFQLALDYKNWFSSFRNNGKIDRDSLAQEVTNWFRKKTNDLHFILQYVGKASAGAINVSRKGISGRNNYGITKSGITWNNLGYMEYCFFHPKTMDATKVLDSTIESFQDAKAVILDLRKNIGGDGDMAAYIIGFFIDQDSLPLWKFESRYNGQETSEIKFAKRRNKTNLVNKDIYILTSDKTASSAEVFTQICKSNKLATVIGMPTAGGTHAMATFQVLNEFTFGLPHGRILDFVTGEDTQKQNGIVPDIATKEDEALNKAIEVITSK